MFDLQEGADGGHGRGVVAEQEGAVVCAAEMGEFLEEPRQRHGGANPGANEVADLTAAAAANSMSPGERRKYRLTLVVLAIVWLTVVVTFSPWGVGRAG